MIRAQAASPRQNGEPIDLILYSMPGCGPCAVVKRALEELSCEGIGRIETQILAIEEIRALRRQIGRLSFPILVAKLGDTILGRRLGAVSQSHVEEQLSLNEWLASLRA